MRWFGDEEPTGPGCVHPRFPGFHRALDAVSCRGQRHQLGRSDQRWMLGESAPHESPIGMPLSALAADLRDPIPSLRSALWSPRRAPLQPTAHRTGGAALSRHRRCCMLSPGFPSRMVLDFLFFYYFKF